MYRVLSRVMFVAIAILALSIISIYGLFEYYNVTPTNRQIKDLAMTVWVATMIGSATISIIRRRV